MLSAAFTINGSRLAYTLPTFSCPIGITIFNWGTNSVSNGVSGNIPVGNRQFENTLADDAI